MTDSEIRQISIQNWIAFLKEQFSLVLLLFMVFAFPGIVREYVRRRSFENDLSGNPLINLVLVIITGLLALFGVLSIALCAYAYQSNKETSFRLVLRSAFSIIGPAIIIYICQGLIFLIPLILLMLVVALVEIPLTISSLLYGALTVSFIDFLFFFAWPLLIYRQIPGFRNAVASIRLSLKKVKVVIPFIVPHVLLTLMMGTQYTQSDPLLWILFVIGTYAMFYLISALEMFTYRAICLEDDGLIDRITRRKND